MTRQMNLDEWANAMPMIAARRPKPIKHESLEDQGIIGLSVEDVTRMQADLGRKFEAEDVDEYLYDAAMTYARDYVSDFSYMVDMAIQAHRTKYLSDRQAKGVLNCMAAEGRYRARKSAPVVEEEKFIGTSADSALRPDAPRVENGRYTIIFNNDESDYITLRVQDDFRADATPGSKVIQYLSGADNESSYTGFAFLNCPTQLTHAMTVQVWNRFKGNSRLWDAAILLTQTPEEAGMAYALKENRCRRCGRTLTVPASIHAGYGPECRTKIGGEM